MIFTYINTYIYDCRDAVHIDWEFKERKFRLVDTAGLQKISPDTGLLRSAEERRRMQAMENTGRFDKSLPGVREMDPEEDPSQFSQQVSEMALISALNALRFAQVVLLMVEGDQGKFSKVDLQIARKCLDEGRSVVIAANKCDLVSLRGVSAAEYEAGVRKHCAAFLRELGEVKVVACSTLKKEHVFK